MLKVPKTLHDFADYIRENVFDMDTNRIVRMKNMPELDDPVYCTVLFTNSASQKPAKLNDPKKAVGFSLGNESSIEILKKPLWRWLMMAGLDPRDLLANKNAKKQAWLVLFQTKPETFVQPAHWEGVIDFVQHYYPDVYMPVHAHAFKVRHQSLSEFEKELGFRFDTTLDDPNLFMSYDKLKGLFPEQHLPPSVAETRLFLYCQMCLDQTFYGDGFVRQWDHSRGARQYLMPNLDLKGDNFELIPFKYDVPAYFD